MQNLDGILTQKIAGY